MMNAVELVVQGVIYSFSMAEPLMVLTLIHGTFAADADWVKEGSALRKILTKETKGNVVFRSYRWSGGNTHSQRLDDAELLCRDMRKAFTEFRAGRHFLIAHSHGGNLALYALREGELRSKLAGVVTMGTPFIHCTAREVWLAASIIKWSGSIFGVFGCIVCWAILTSTDWARSVEGRLEAWNKGMSSMIFLGTMISTLVLGLFLARLLWWVVDECVLDWAVGRQRSLMERLNVSGMGQVPLLCGAVTGDEAGRWLSSIRVVGNLGHVGFGFVAAILRYGWAIFLLLFLLTVMQVALPKFGGIFEGIFNGIGHVVEFCMVAAIVLQAIMIFLPALTRGHRFGYGEGHPADNWLCDVSISTTPVGISCELFKVSLDEITTSSGLRHSSFYENAQFLQYVGSWIRRRPNDRSG